MRECAICGKEFPLKQHRQNTCSWDCRQEKNRSNARAIMRSLRHHGKKICEPCVICGFSETTDIHHEGKYTHILCPNHHALITRNIKTLR